MKRLVFLLLFSSFVLALYVVTTRGRLGVPTPAEIDYQLSSNGRAFETSQERSRYAIILSLVNHHTFELGEYASMGTPDIGRVGDKYYSFFPPAVSILAIPLYLLGLKLNAVQITTFAISTIFALLTLLVLYRFARALRLSTTTSLFAVLAFGFGTNAWGYSVTLYAHLASAFVLLAGLYTVTVSRPNRVSAITVWLLYAFAIFIDFPNIFTFFPIALVAGLRLFDLESNNRFIKFGFRPALLIGPLVFLACMIGYGYYNYIHFGSPLKLSNTIDRVKDLKSVANSSPEVKRLHASAALSPRKLINGLYTFTVSHDRGVLIYTPVALLFIFGLAGLARYKNLSLKLLLIGVPLTNLLTYSMFGDPYGGWAFGSRYMIAIMPELVLLGAIGLDNIKNHSNKIIKISALVLYSLVTLYSSAMSLLAPLTTNVIPPSVEAGTFALADDYRIPLEMLRLSHLNSFVYKSYLSNTWSGYDYYLAIYIPLALVYLALIWAPSNRVRGKK